MRCDQGELLNQVNRYPNRYVGAELDILGRITTLRHCSESTAEWNSYWAEVLGFVF